MSPQQQRIVEAFNVRGYYHGGMMGLGDDVRPITAAIGSGLLSAGGVIAATGVGLLPGAIVSAVGALTSLIGGMFAPDLTKIQATHIVDAVEVQLNQLLASWQSLPASQKTRTNQAAYEELISGALAKVQQGCSNPALGTAGQNCISERLIQGGPAPWCPTANHTGCDWVTAYLLPIQNDPNVIPDPVSGGAGPGGSSVVGSIDTATSQVSSALGISPLAIGAALIGFALFLGSD